MDFLASIGGTEQTRARTPTAELISIIKHCRSLQRGKELHSLAVEWRCHNNKYVRSALLTMYGRCGSMSDAQYVFDGMKHQDVVSWTALISGYVENGQSLKALKLFENMKCRPDRVTFVAAVKACTSLVTCRKLDKQICLVKGMDIHRLASERGYNKDVYLASSLIDMYSKCGDLSRAKDVFDKTEQRDAVLWNALILGYVENGICSGGLNVFQSMTSSPNKVTFVAALKACIGVAAGNELDKRTCLLNGKAIHEQARAHGLDRDIAVGNTLVSMYGKAGDMQTAEKVFNGLPQRTVVSWTALVLSYVENGLSYRALDVFDSMDCEPDCAAFVAGAKACGALASEREKEKSFCLEKGQVLHEHARDRGLDKDMFLASTLIDMYCKCGSMQHARSVFDGMVNRSEVTWSVLMLGYVENGDSQEALDVFEEKDCIRGRSTFVAALKACTGLARENRLGKERLQLKGTVVHRQVKEAGYETDVIVCSVLLEMYSSLGEISKARNVFDGMVDRDAVAWSSLILGFVENGESREALEVFKSMDCTPDSGVFVAAIKACSSLREGVCVHAQARELGFDKDVYVASTLVDMYSKLGDMSKAQEVFDGMKTRSVVSWNVLIHSYVENDASYVALNKFYSMDCEPDEVTFVAALKACAELAALEAGQRIHDQVYELGFEADRKVASCLVDFYGKCGCMAAAEEVFNRLPFRDIVAWNAVIGGYSFIGDTARVISSVKRMREAGLQMDGVTALFVLTACNEAGLVEEGCSYFNSMASYGIEKTREHYTCMVDILGRANKLQEALSLVKDMPFESDSHICMSLLESCRKWRNVEVAETVFTALVNQSSDKGDAAGAYVLMRKLYEQLGTVPPMRNVRTLKFLQGVEK